MNRISSVQTVLLKRIYPLGSLVMMPVLAAFVVPRDALWEQPGPLLLMLAIGLAGIAQFWWMMRDLADEVVDGGSFLVVRKGGVEERIPLADVIGVETRRYANPTRVILKLRNPGRLGDEVAFIPQATFYLNPFACHPLAESLKERIDRMRLQT